jgi:hypothetical protein
MSREDSGEAVSVDITETVLSTLLGDGRTVQLQPGSIRKINGTYSPSLKGGPMLTIPVEIASAPIDGTKPLTKHKWAVVKMLMEDEAYRGEQILWAGFARLEQAQTKDVLVAITSLGQITIASITNACCFESYGTVLERLNVMNLSAAFLTGNATLQLVSDGGKSLGLVTSPEAAVEIFRLVWLLHTIGTGRQTLQHNMSNRHLPSAQLPPLPKDGGLHTSYMMHATASRVAAPELGSVPGRATRPVGLKQFQTFPSLSYEVATEARRALAALSKAQHHDHMTEHTAISLIRKGLPMLKVDATSWKLECLRPLALALRFNDTIKAVVAADSLALGDHMGSFAKMLQSNTSVLRLAFSNCGIPPQTCVAFGDAMTANRFCALAGLPSFRSSVFPLFLPSFLQHLASFLPGLLPSFLPSTSCFLPFFVSSFFLPFLPSFLHSFSFIPSFNIFLPSFLQRLSFLFPSFNIFL